MDSIKKLKQEINNQLAIYKERVEPAKLQAFIDLPEKNFYMHDKELNADLCNTLLIPGTEMYKLFEANGVVHPNDMTGILLREWHRILNCEDSVVDSLIQPFQNENAANNKKTIAFSGHRPKSLPWGSCEDDARCIAFKEHLRSILEKSIQSGYSKYLSGMAQGVDLIAARIVLDLKKIHSHISLECVVPYENQASTWSVEQREEYYNILAECDKVHTLNTHYHDGVYRERNEFLVKEATALIAVLHNKRSGTGQTVNLAKKADKLVHIIDPANIKGEEQ